MKKSKDLQYFPCFIVYIIVTRNNIVWKLARRLLFMLLQNFFASARLHRVHKNFCYRNVQYIICAS